MVWQLPSLVPQDLEKLFEILSSESVARPQHSIGSLQTLASRALQIHSKELPGAKSSPWNSRWTPLIRLVNPPQKETCGINLKALKKIPKLQELGTGREMKHTSRIKMIYTTW